MSCRDVATRLDNGHGLVQTSPLSRLRLTQAAEVFTLETELPAGWSPIHRLTLEPQLPADYEPLN